MICFASSLLKKTAHPEVCLFTVTRTQLLDVAWNERLYEEILSAALSAGTARVVLDCRRVRFLSGETAAALRHAQEELGRRGGGLICCGLSPRTAALLRLAGVVGREEAPVAVAGDVAAAVALWQRRSPAPARRPDAALLAV